MSLETVLPQQFLWWKIIFGLCICASRVAIVSFELTAVYLKSVALSSVFFPFCFVVGRRVISKPSTQPPRLHAPCSTVPWGEEEGVTTGGWGISRLMHWSFSRLSMPTYILCRTMEHSRERLTWLLLKNLEVDFRRPRSAQWHGSHSGPQPIQSQKSVPSPNYNECTPPSFSTIRGSGGWTLINPAVKMNCHQFLVLNLCSVFHYQCFTVVHSL